ncbi:glycosyltransferase [Stenotrophomonas sp. UBA7606]|uniref:glycosyltransferase n=1 Tax=Stenotrophomonas sp. UBA7606 TaxID=1947559 RepID=UPI0025FBDEB8|nr:glycosyltransferase [Stenotrophomonas sp. UBA7606]
MNSLRRDLEHRLLEAILRIQTLEQQLSESADDASGIQHYAILKGSIGALQKELEALRASDAYRLGRLLVDTSRNPRRLGTWPGIAFRLIKRRVRRNKGVTQDPSVLAALPEAGPKERSVVGANIAGELVEVPAPNDLPLDISKLRIALVCDRFTWDSLSMECEVCMLDPQNWAEQLRTFRPHLVFVESAWTGLQGEWEGKVVSAGLEIASLALSCRHAGLPAYFWNKEDPLHFEAFIQTASLFEHVFTTDAESIPEYRRKLGHSRISLLPFAAQPQLHHPFADANESRENGSFFAGAWYGYLTQRCTDFYKLATALSLAGPFRIHDRNDGKGGLQRRYPQHFSRFLWPAVAYEKTPALYRGSQIGLTLNTIKQSSSMFARRALELACTNTSVYSNYSRALRLMFGDLFRITDDGHTALDWAMTELENPDELDIRARRLLAMRKVLAEFTWSTRLGTIFRQLGGGSSPSALREIVVICRVSDSAQLARLMRMVERQKRVRVNLQVACSDNLILPAAVGRLHANELEQPLERLFPDSLVALWSVDDCYGSYYLSDLVDCLKFRQGEVVGKACFMSSRAGTLALVGEGLDYRRVDRLAWRRSLAKARFWPFTAGELLANTEQGHFVGEGLLSTDRESYRESSLEDNIPEIGIAGGGEGLSLSELESFVREMAEAVDCEGGAELSGETLAALFDGISLPAQISIASKNGSMELVSKLAKGIAEAAFSRPFSASSLHDGRKETHVRLQAALSASCHFYLDELLGDNLTVGRRYRLLPETTITVPSDISVSCYRLAVGLEGPYVGYVSALVIGDGLPVPLVLPGKGRLLVVVNGYPRSEDLYRNAFVHTRVKNYLRRGIGVDVVWVSSHLPKHAYEYDGVPIIVCDAATLRSTLRLSGHSAVAVHFLDEELWEGISEAVEHTRSVVWVHGAEIQSSKRRIFNYRDEISAAHAEMQSQSRKRFWQRRFADFPAKLELVFVSQNLSVQAREDVEAELPIGAWRVIHNPIDTDVFTYLSKPSDQRFKFLSIRPHATRIYANDLVAAVIHRLAFYPEFTSMTFTLVGDGELWEENFSSLRQYSNVILRREFLAPAEISALHRNHGVFLVPTRGDTQGVSRDEAMSSGLVPVTSKIGGVPEFVDETCGMVCEPEDVEAMVQACLEIVRNPALFTDMSRAAAKRVRSQSEFSIITDLEIEVLGLVDF